MFQLDETSFSRTISCAELKDDVVKFGLDGCLLKGGNGVYAWRGSTSAEMSLYFAAPT